MLVQRMWRLEVFGMMMMMMVVRLILGCALSFPPLIVFLVAVVLVAVVLLVVPVPVPGPMIELIQAMIKMIPVFVCVRICS